MLQSKVERAWDEHALSAVVKVWFIPHEAGGEDQLARALIRDLEALSEEGTIVEATAAIAKPDRLRVAVVVDPAYRPEDVTTAVFNVLADPKRGVLAKANARIGGVLMRAEIAAAVRSVAGVRSACLWRTSAPTLNVPAHHPAGASALLGETTLPWRARGSGAGPLRRL